MIRSEKNIHFFANLIAIALLVAASCFYGLRSFQYHRQLIQQENLVDYRGGAHVLGADLIVHGESPYSARNQPVHVNAYGFLYPLLGAGIIKLFGSEPEPFRLLSGIFIWLSLAVVFWALKKKNVPTSHALAGVVILYSSLLYGVTPLIRPDALGTFLFLSSVFIPYIFNYSTRSLAGVIVLCIAAFYAKPYFVLGAPLLASYIFLFKSRRKGILFGIAFFIVFSACWAIVALTQEFYFHNVIYINMTHSVNSLSWALGQLHKIVTRNSGLFVILSTGIVWAVWRKLNLTDLKDAGLPLYGLLVTLLVVYFKLGRHDGAYMNYLFQLISPFLIMSALIIGNISKMPGILISLLIVLNLYTSFAFLPGFNCPATNAWKELDTLVARHDKILAPAALSLVMLNNQKEIYDNGMTEYFQTPVPQNPPKWMYPYENRLDEKLDSFKHVLSENILHKQFDLVIMARDNGPPFISQDALEANYSLASTLEACLPHTYQKIKFDIFVPKPM